MLLAESVAVDGEVMLVILLVLAAFAAAVAAVAMLGGWTAYRAGRHRSTPAAVGALVIGGGEALLLLLLTWWIRTGGSPLLVGMTSLVMAAQAGAWLLGASRRERDGP